MSPTLDPIGGDLTACFAGDKLYGDDFDLSAIQAWYADEAEGYAQLGAADRSSYRYGYHALNTLHGFRHLPEGRLADVLGFGSAYGDELAPIIGRIDTITIVDPSGAFVQPTVHGLPARYVKPAVDGLLPLPGGAFDLVTCLGVLHHIPNVSFVVGELARVLRPGGWMLLREPIVSMGDWRQPRAGLTRRERGIPLHLLERSSKAAGLDVVHSAVCDFVLTPRVGRLVRSDVYNSAMVTRLDAWWSRLFAWNLNYHPRRRLDRLRPTSAFLVLRKPVAMQSAT